MQRQGGDTCWDWVRGLDVVVMVDSNTLLDSILREIDDARPEQLNVIDQQRRLGWMVLSCQPKMHRDW